MESGFVFCISAVMSLCGQDVGLTERAASEESDTGEKLEQDDLQQYGPTVCSPAADPSSAGSKVKKAHTDFGRIRFCKNVILISKVLNILK